MLQQFLKLKFTPFAIMIALLITFVVPVQSSALSGSEFSAGRIIDDGIFFDSTSMNSNTVQRWIESKQPSCPSASPGCLKNYVINTPSRAADQYCTGNISGGYKYASQIIVDVGLACSVSPKVMLVLLQKEQSLITNTNPSERDYKFATGFCVYDTGPPPPSCADTDGFFNQLYYAARQYQKYARNASSFSYRAGQNNNILYHPNSGACGSSNVFIQNQATAGLYNYTPYQPNAAALANLYGTGDGCSSYGNRNFWRLYNDWFGSPVGCPYVDSNYIYRLYRIRDNDYLYTQNPTEICAAVKQYDYVIEGKSMTSLGPNDSGARSLFRLSRGGIHLYTTDSYEVYLAMNQYGYAYEGVAYYVNASSSGSNYPVYRLSRNSHYVMTTSVVEKESFQATGYQYEGTLGYANSPSSKIPVYRLSKNGMHIYTPDPVERDLAKSLNGFSDEGIAFYAQSGVTGDTGTVFRLERSGRYLNTTNINERASARVSNYRQEPSYYYAYLPNYPGTYPIHRLVNRQNGDYLLTTNETEKNQAMQLYGYSYEGVVFNGSP